MKTFNWNADKNQQLIAERGKSFEEVVFHIQNGDLLDDIAHPNKMAYAHQRIFVVNILGYAWLVPYVENETEVFLKTIIPSRQFTKRYLGGDL
ncbi:BrnT family toxin [Endozoicomonas euniceicola]|uniref:BrnT family toxin n=1 Tax=Endozoicomonas euniceicola TaxID=1234143 RepID=A0ABY6H0F1_9GAMM|nr:BrnT family toxin [Endozoicomonas euniceicola]UYM18530.1 BrnT family toxin [Endozoicomonas euniceicola]